MLSERLFWANVLLIVAAVGLLAIHHGITTAFGIGLIALALLPSTKGI